MNKDGELFFLEINFTCSVFYTNGYEGSADYILNYDGIGQWRTTDQGQTVNASGTVSGTDVDGTFDGAVDLAHKLSESPDVRDCVATEWFRYAMGRGEATPDTCALQSLKDSFAGTQADIRQLLVAVTQTDTFRYRMAVTP